MLVLLVVSHYSSLAKKTRTFFGINQTRMVRQNCNFSHQNGDFSHTNAGLSSPDTHFLHKNADVRQVSEKEGTTKKRQKIERRRGEQVRYFLILLLLLYYVQS